MNPFSFFNIAVFLPFDASVSLAVFKHRPSLVIVMATSLLLNTPANATTPHQCPTEALKVVSTARQLVTVTSPSWNEKHVKISWWQRASTREAWQLKRSGVSAVIGRAGLAWGFNYLADAKSEEPRKVEGDGRTPAGVHRVGRKFGFEAPHPQNDFLVLKPSTYCVDDPSSKHYNSIVDTQAVKKDWNSGEAMRSIDVYKIGLVIDYRSDRQHRAGSCIFAHIWNDPDTGTAGCLAAPETIIAELQQWLEPNLQPAIAFLTQEYLEKWSQCLPIIQPRE